MNTSGCFRWLLWRIFAPVMLLCVVLSTAQAERNPGSGLVQPKNYASPNRTYTLFIDPGDRYGHGSAKYKFCKNGTEVWSAEREYTLQEVAVTDQGQVSGFAYREIKNEPTPNAGGDPERPLIYHDPDEFLHIVVLDATGRELRNEVIKRESFRNSSHPPPPAPEILQVVHDQSNDRFILRVRARGTKWWVYSLSTGEQTAKIDEESVFADADRLSFVVDLKPIKGTPLLLVHGFIKSRDWKIKDDGGRFSIVGTDLKPLWSLDAPEDYVALDLYKNAYMGFGGPDSFFETEPAIREANDQRRFDIRLFKEGKNVSFEAKKSADGSYSVEERGRIDFKLEDPKAEQESRVKAALAELPPLPYLGELMLTAESDSDAPFKELWDFTFDKDGNIYVMEQCKSHPCELVMIDPTGKPIARRPMTERTEKSQIDWSDSARLGDGKYFVRHYVDGEDTGTENNSWWADLKSGEMTPLGLHLGWINAISRLSDGGFITLDSSNREKSNGNHRIARYNSDGSIRWTTEGDRYDENSLTRGYAKDVVFTSDERIVVLSMRTVQIADASGKLISSINLKDVLGKEPGYLHEVVADKSGGFFILGSGNAPTATHFDRDGKVLAQWSPRHVDGKTFTPKGGLCIDASGRVWTSDGRSLYQLDDNGVVFASIGSAPRVDHLTGLAGLTVDLQGNLYAVAKDTGVIHKFDSEGKALRRFEPDPKDMAGTVLQSFIAVNNNGDVFLKKPATKQYMPPDEYLRFSADGDRLENIAFQPSIPVGQFLSAGWSFQPHTGYRCGICGIAGDNRLVIVDPPGKLLREERRRPNGNWFGWWNNLSMGADGTMAVLNSDLQAKPPRYEVDLFTESGDGIRTIVVPEPVDRWNAVAHDATRILIAGNKELLVMDHQGARQQRYVLSDEDTQWSLFILPTGRQLLTFGQRSKRVHRYELPQLEVARTEKTSEKQAVRPDPEAASIKSPWVKKYMEIAVSLPERKSCAVYAQKINNGEQVITEEMAALLADDERGKLRPLNLDEGCGLRIDAPQVYARMLDILADVGVHDVANARVLDVGCCDNRHIRALAPLGTDIVIADFGFNLRTLCSEWDELRNSTAQAGQIEWIRLGGIQPEEAMTKLGGGFNLITLRNTLHGLDEHNYYGTEPWRELYLAKTPEEFARNFFALTAPGGVVIGYSVVPQESPLTSAISQGIWQSAGFEIIAFDKDDLPAALAIGLELGWDKHVTPLEGALKANFSIFKKPA